MIVKTVGVVGAGVMGSGIAQVAARAGLRVVLEDTNPQVLAKSRQSILASLAKILAKQDSATAAERLEKCLARIRFSTVWQDLAEVEFAIEAISENFVLKRDVFQELDRVLPPTSVLATNTSSISTTQLAACVGRPDRVIGMHFMNPVPLMQLVEVIRALQTSAGTYETALELAETLGKTPIEVNDSPGFVSNRILIPMLNEAMFVLHEGLGSVESIDSVMTLGMNHPMGPLRLADLIGLDVCLDILNVLYEGFRDPKYRPCPLLTKMVAAGYLGRKCGRGFYQYRVQAN